MVTVRSALCPFLLAFVRREIDLRGVRADFEKAAPLPPLRHVRVVLHVTADAAQGVAVRATAIRLQRVRRDAVEIAARAGEDRADGEFGDGGRRRSRCPSSRRARGSQGSVIYPAAMIHPADLGREVLVGRARSLCLSYAQNTRGLAPAAGRCTHLISLVMPRSSNVSPRVKPSSLRRAVAFRRMSSCR